MKTKSTALRQAIRRTSRLQTTNKGTAFVWYDPATGLYRQAPPSSPAVARYRRAKLILAMAGLL